MPHARHSAFTLTGQLCSAAKLVAYLFKKVRKQVCSVLLRIKARGCLDQPRPCLQTSGFREPPGAPRAGARPVAGSLLCDHGLRRPPSEGPWVTPGCSSRPCLLSDSSSVSSGLQSGCLAPLLLFFQCLGEIFRGSPKDWIFWTVFSLGEHFKA